MTEKEPRNPEIHQKSLRGKPMIGMEALETSGERLQKGLKICHRENRRGRGRAQGVGHSAYFMLGKRVRRGEGGEIEIEQEGRFELSKIESLSSGRHHTGMGLSKKKGEPEERDRLTKLDRLRQRK